MKGKILILSVLFFVLFLSKPKITHAEVISSEIALGGMSKAIADYCDRHENVNLEKVVSESVEDVILARIVEAEVTGGSVEQKMNVVSVILNRVASPKFPNTVKEVVFERSKSKGHWVYQFSPVQDERYYSVTITDSSREAVLAVRQQGLTTSATYFCTPNCKSAKKGGWHYETLEYLFCDNMHNFYKTR